MPIAKFPRPGMPIAPKLLESHLQATIPGTTIRFADLDASVWQKHDSKTCVRMAKQLERFVLQYRDSIVPVLQANKIVPSGTALRLDLLTLTYRTLNSVARLILEHESEAIEELTLFDLYVHRGFGWQCILDWMTAVEHRCETLRQEQRNTDDSKIGYGLSTAVARAIAN